MPLNMNEEPSNDGEEELQERGQGERWKSYKQRFLGSASSSEDDEGRGHHQRHTQERLPVSLPPLLKSSICGPAAHMGRRRLILKGTKQCSTKEEEEDLISALPDDILRSILSLLPIKNDVKTSILSSRWRYLWAYRSNLDFDVHNMVGTSILERGLQDEEGLRLLNSAFVCRVGNVLQHYRGPRIYSMAVSYCFNQESFSHLDRWIGFAIAMKVEELKIILQDPPYRMYTPHNCKVYDFPCLLFSHEKISCLKHLQLQICDLECPPNFNGFNSLVTVDLQEVKLNESSLESFFF